MQNYQYTLVAWTEDESVSTKVAVRERNIMPHLAINDSSQITFCMLSDRWITKPVDERSAV